MVYNSMITIALNERKWDLIMERKQLSAHCSITKKHVTSYPPLGYQFDQSIINSRHQVFKLEYSLRLKIKINDWLLADTCPQAANHSALL